MPLFLSDPKYYANIIEYIIIHAEQVAFTHANSYPIVLLLYLCTKKHNNDDGHIISQLVTPNELKL